MKNDTNLSGVSFPEGFDPSQYNEIPDLKAPYNHLFEGSDKNLEIKAREAIRQNLEKRLNKAVVPRSALLSRFGLRNYGYTVNDIESGKVLVR